MLLEQNIQQDSHFVKVVSIQLETQNQDAVKLLMKRADLIKNKAKDETKILEISQQLVKAQEEYTIYKPHSVFVTFETQLDYLIAHRSLK